MTGMPFLWKSKFYMTLAIYVKERERGIIDDGLARYNLLQFSRVLMFFGSMLQQYLKK